MELTTITDEELDQLRVEVFTEQERRRLVADAPAQAAVLAERYAIAIGRQDGDPWVQPTGAHDAYPVGITVTHDGKTWENLTPANVWPPGVSGWREQVAQGYPAWVQPTGAHDAYQKGDRVSFDGSDYESLIDGNTWSPSAYPDGWKTI